MKTIRELINLIESAQNPAKPIIAWVEPATCSTMSNDEYENNPFANETGDWKPIHTQEELAVWQDRREEKKRGQALGQNPVAEDWIDDDAAEPLAKHFAELYYNGLSPADEAKMAAHVYQQVVDGEMSIDQLKQHIAKLEKEKGIKEATNVNNLLSKATKDANKDFKKAKADKLKAAGDYFTKGDHWQGAKPGDYGYTGYQGHGMPTDRAEQARIRADKKKQQDK